jgi:hypothetical protein
MTPWGWSWQSSDNRKPGFLKNKISGKRTKKEKGGRKKRGREGGSEKRCKRDTNVNFIWIPIQTVKNL